MMFYGQIPFEIHVDTTHFQLVGELMKLKFINNQTVEITIDLDGKNEISLLHYNNFSKQTYSLKSPIFKQKFSIGKIETDFMSFDFGCYGKSESQRRVLYSI
jgi:hypothetical protein